MSSTSALSRIEHIIAQNRQPNWAKDFPVIGQGTLIFSFERDSKFFIVIRPKLEPGEAGADEWIALTIKEDTATFSMHHNKDVQTLKEVTGFVKNQFVGYEPGRKISYWFSYNRELLTLKYGKGYCMEETTLMTYNFMSGVPDSEQAATRKEYEFLFSPSIRRRIEHYDEMPVKMMLEKYRDMILHKGYQGTPLIERWPKFKSSKSAQKSKADDLAKSLIDIEGTVAFEKVPFVCNWSPFVLDSSKVNLFELDSNAHTFSASLPPACLELYSNVTAQNVDINWPHSIGNHKLSDAIRYSLNTESGLLYKKLKAKQSEFGSSNMTYLRVTLGTDRGSSPGVPYVLEIWPSGHGSPIHNHGNAYAVIKVLHGGLTIKIFNKQVDEEKAKPLQQFDVKEGDCTWISPNWFQTHQLWNSTSDYCATIQCYKYGDNDLTQWPYFDYVESTEVIDEFLPNSDITFREMQGLVMHEYTEYMRKEKEKQ